jgi:hypothetical protein
MAQEAIIDGNLINDARPLAVETQNDSQVVTGPLTDAELRATAPAVEAQGRASGTLTTPRLDASTSTMQGIDYPHHEIHSGSAWAIGVNDADLDTADELTIAFTTPDTTKWLHVVAIAANLVPYNLNRNSATTSGILSIKAIPVANQATLTPTITNDGTAIWTESLGGNKNQGSSAGAATRDERILKQNTTYAFRLTGVADNGVASIGLHWYEHTDVA